jgi:hypothetical protein
MASVSTAGKTLYFYDGTVWIPVGGGGAPTGASVIYSASQPDVTDLEVGTIWVDSDATISGGGGGGGGTGGPSFQTIVTSPVSASIVAATAGEVLTLISGENISIVNASANNSITFNSTGNYTSVDSISYPDYIVFDTTPENTSASTSTLAWDAGEGGLGIQLNPNVQVTLGQEIIVLVNNNNGSTISKGQAVYLYGAQGQRPSVRLASNTSDTTSAKTLGIAAENILAGAEGFVVSQGVVKNINTNAYNEGDVLWLGTTPGSLTTTKPQGPLHGVFVGVVTKKNASSGRIYVKAQNGYELDELHDVRISGVANDDLILYNSASSIWVNSPKQNIINTASAAAVSYLVDGAPAALDTLNELSAALNDNANILDTLLTTTAASSTYLPKTASAAFTRWTKTLSASATVISGVDDNSITLQYNPSYEQVFINGVLIANNEYTATSGSAIVLAEAAVVNDVIDIYAYQNSTNVNTYSQAQIDAKYNNLTRWKKIYSASATVISGNDDNSLPLSYTSGYEQVYLNGILLTPITDYARTSASVITLPSAVVTNDVIEVINIQPFNVADVYTTAQADSTFLTLSTASSTYLTQSSASTTYATNSSVTSTYTPLSSPITSYKNKIINGGFDIWQRGTSFSAGGYTADRWLLQVDGSGATRSVSQQTLTPGSISGFESQFFLRYNQSVAGTGGTFNIIDQRIEDVRTLAGQTVTVSFWAKADSARTIDSSIQQVFGSGGSSEVAGLSSGNINLTTSWTRYSYTGTLASISGKTVGAGSYAALRFNFPRNTTFTIDIEGVQVEKGSIATEFEQRFIGDELRMCQRYYQVHSKWYTFWNTANNTAAGGVIFDLPFRTTPAIVSGTQSSLYRYGPGGQRSSTLLAFQDYGTQSAYVIVTDNGGTPFTTNYPSVHNVVGHFSAEL